MKFKRGKESLTLNVKNMYRNAGNKMQVTHKKKTFDKMPPRADKLGLESFLSL